MYIYKERERERTQNSKLYYTRVKILGSCLFLQSVPANLHANRLHINNSNNTDYRSTNGKDDNVGGGGGGETETERQRQTGRQTETETETEIET